MVWEHKVPPATMYINHSTHQPVDHAAALDVPAGPSLSPGAAPAGLTRLSSLPQGKVSWTALTGVNHYTFTGTVVILKGQYQQYHTSYVARPGVQDWQAY